MKGWLIYNKTDAKQNESYIDWFREEAHLQNLSLQLILREDLTVGIMDNKPAVMLQDRPVELPDFAVIRTIEPFLNYQLESFGVAVYNSSETAFICNDKARTHFHMSKLAIPMADTVYISSKTGLPASPPLAFPLVVKNVSGRGGAQVEMVKNPQEWQHLQHHPSTEDLVIQSAANIQSGKDVRVFVIGSEIIGAVMRENKHDFRANYKLGGSASWYPLNTHEIALVKDICESFRFGMVGIDFLLNHDGRFIFNEIEDVVGSRTLSAVSDINILQKYLAYIKSGSPT
ncbi:RimK family alpha-L-glutamate ligase [Lentibacillus sp. CBA3610]|uniref:ATP-grasp domain-containing protein n=1 Tax=Lentibacillus sp. CBA3610 TaxID=2518176 RepID=UPI0015957824|nr:ATP-grasp domain-containing protein [Lentibacillus sp. CBA3610]QKY69587.1 ATP-grasp domain-containing protein [Lentibacillus sp. CBA3610]